MKLYLQPYGNVMDPGGTERERDSGDLGLCFGRISNSWVRGLNSSTAALSHMFQCSSLPPYFMALASTSCCFDASLNRGYAYLSYCAQTARLQSVRRMPDFARDLVAQELSSKQRLMHCRLHVKDCVDKRHLSPLDSAAHISLRRSGSHWADLAVSMPDGLSRP